MTLSEQELLDIHEKWLSKQKSLEPSLTISLMMETAGYNSPYSVQNILPRMIEMGLVEPRQHGQITKYRILDRK